jgi:hypothetical protein
MRAPHRKTVRLPDGYNGDTMIFYADPICVEGRHARLQCAEPGKSHLFRWVEIEDGEIVGVAPKCTHHEPKVRLRDLLCTALAAVEARQAIQSKQE